MVYIFGQVIDLITNKPSYKCTLYIFKNFLAVTPKPLYGRKVVITSLHGCAHPFHVYLIYTPH